jgi:hypothetical protein
LNPNPRCTRTLMFNRLPAPTCPMTSLHYWRRLMLVSSGSLNVCDEQ